MIRRVVVALALVSATLVVGNAGPRLSAAQSPADDESVLLVNEARAAIKAGRYKRAGKLLDRALKVNPRSVRAYVLRASVFGVFKQYGRAVAIMRRAQRLAPNNPDVLTALGSQLMLAKRFDEAVPLLERVVAASRDRYEAQVQLGHYYAKRRAWRKAIAAFAAYFDSRPEVLAREDATHQVDLANAYLRSGEPKTARELYRKVLRANEKSVLGRLGLAWSTAAIDCRKALPLLEGMTDLAARYAEVSMVAGRCALALGQVDRALEMAERYRERRPDDASGWAFLGDAHLAKGDLQAAFAAIGEALDRRSDDRRFSMKMARIERLMGHAQAAAARLRAAGSPVGQEEEWTLELGEALLADEKYASVRELLTPYVANHAEDALARVLLGSALVALGDTSAAAAHLDKALEMEPVKARRARAPLVNALNAEAVAAFERGDLGAAETHLELAATVLENRIALRNLGAVRIEAGRPVEAIPPLEKAASGPGSDGIALHLLGRAHAAAGHLEQARKALEKAIRASQKTPRRRTAVIIDLAAVHLDRGSAQAAVETLTPALASAADPETRKRLSDAYYVAARAAMTGWLSAGAFRRAYKLGTQLEKHLTEKDAGRLLAVRCDLALAATGARMRDVATKRLRHLVTTRAVCPFAEPADRLAIPILLAWNEGLVRKRARKALARLEKLRRRALGPAEPLALAASRDVALRAAADAYERGNLGNARAFLVKAKRIDRASSEVAHNEAVLLLAAGRNIDQAIAKLRRVVGEVPEAHVNLGVAYDTKGDRGKALEHYRKAQKAGVRHGRLSYWIEVKERIWGGRE